MPIAYRVDTAADLLVTRIRGRVSDDDILGFMNQLIADPVYRSGMNGLALARGIDEFDVTSSAMQQAVELAIRAGDRFDGSRWAIIAEHEVVYGMTRMYTMRREAESYEIEVFREPAPALEWLGLQAIEGIA